MNQPELSIIVPVLNEREELPLFCADLLSQREVNFELIVVDGGSRDGSDQWFSDLVDNSEISGQLLSSMPGRGRQLNCGVAAASSDWVLCLHVDSRFSDALSLRGALNQLEPFGSQSVAGHFRLDFRRDSSAHPFGYYYYGWKARLGRPETIHGDQGFLLPRTLIERIGGFRQDLPVMEDSDFAERLQRSGQWVLLDQEISTSARRFETEGLKQRQILNAMMMCLRHIGYLDFFQAAPQIYRQQSRNEPLRLSPYFTLIHQLFARHPHRQRWQIWWHCGCYVRGHAWQLFFALDAWRAYRRGLPIGSGQLNFTRYLEPLYDMLTDNPVGRLLATLLLRLWFAISSFRFRLKEPG